MRLISAHIKGHGRLVDSKINLDAKVIAIVGPNEAGKTTLLNALAHVDAGGELNPAGRSRATTVDDWTTVTEFTYVLDETDHEALADLDLHELPRRMRVGRTAAGDKLFVTPTPSPRKSVKPLEEFLHQLKGAAASSDLDEWIDSATVYADPHSDEARDYRAELATVLSAVEAAITEPGTTLG